MKETDLRDVFKEASAVICTLTAEVSAEILSPTPISFLG
jgi:hypothetical protein